MRLEADIVTSRGGLEVCAAFSVEAGENVVLLGPNGAGKTTLLHALAGLVPLIRGSVVLDDRVLEDTGRGVFVPPELRSMGLVFQDYLLFPHMSVLDNVAFGARARGLRRSEAEDLARAWLRRVDLEQFAGSRARDLSGGEAQRVALARALAPGPKVLLLDEPLTALDVGARARLRRELKRHLDSFGGVRLMVTHDPIEALMMADRLIVVENGKVVQGGTMNDLRSRPRSSYVASLVGLNLYRGRASRDGIELPSGALIAASGPERGEVFATVHPRAVSLYRARPTGSPRNVWSGSVHALDLEGDRVRVEVEGIVPIVAEVTTAAVLDLGLQPGDTVWVSLKATEVNVYPV